MADLEVFKSNLVSSGIVDPDGIHHEFVSGVHGQKIDFDKIPSDSDLFEEWCDVVADAVSERFPLARYPRGVVLLSVAGGTNRLVNPVTERIGQGYTPALTKKVSPKEVTLTDEAEDRILELNPDLVVAVEDVGTAGTTSATAVLATREVLPDGSLTQVVALNTWQRSTGLPRLEEIRAPYFSIISESMPSYEPERCRKIGFCAMGWKFIPHD